MATLQTRRRLKRGASGLDRALNEYKECLWMKPKDIKANIQSQDLWTKLISTVESYRQYENFYKDVPSFGNILASLYLTSTEDGHIMKAEEVNREILGIFPENIGALFVQVQILIFKDEHSEANQIIEKMKEISFQNNTCVSTTEKSKMLKEHECMSRADHAFYLMQLGPKHFTEAIKLFQDAVDFFEWQCNEARPTLPEMYHISWTYFLIKTYNRMISASFPGKFVVSPPDTCFDQICHLLPNILRPKNPPLPKYQQNLSEYQGMVYMELYDAFTKIQNKHYPNYNYVRSVRKAFKLKGGKRFDKEDWLMKAEELAPNNGHVLERLGRHYRVIATNMNEFQLAVDFLEKCTQLYPQRHVALHQLSSCYKSMWHEDEGLEEKRLHSNSIKKGTKDKKYGNKKKKSRNSSESSGFACNSKQAEVSRVPWKQWKQRGTFQMSEGRFTGNTTYQKQEVCRLGAKSGRVDEEMLCQGYGVDEMELDEREYDSLLDGGSIVSESGDANDICEETYLCGVATGLSSNQNMDCNGRSQVEPQVMPELRGTVIIPNKTVGVGEIKKHYSKPDYFDTLRTSNPVTVQKSTPEYLKKAVDCLEKANDIVKHTVVTYLIDLARLYISAGCHCDTRHDVAWFDRCDECASHTEWEHECSSYQNTGFKRHGTVHYSQIKHDENCCISLAKKIFENKIKMCPEVCISDHDKAYYKEQYALFLEKQLTTGPPDALEDAVYKKMSEKINSLFRESVVYSIQAREKSRIAFYNLRDKLKDKVETSTHEEQQEAKEELVLLEMWGANFSRCKDLINEVLKSNPEALHMQWQLVYSFARNKKYQNAYQYMKPLLSPDNILLVLEEPVETECPDTPRGINSDFCLTVAFQSAELNIKSGMSGLCPEIYRCVLDGLLTLNKFKFEESPDASEDKMTDWMDTDEDMVDVLILAEEDTLSLSKIEDLLKDFAGLKMFSDNDILTGQVPFEAFGECKAKAIMIPQSAVKTNMWLPTVDKILDNNSQPKVCICTESGTVMDKLKHLPKVDMKNFEDNASDLEKNKMIEQVFRALLLDYHEYVTCGAK